MTIPKNANSLPDILQPVTIIALGDLTDIAAIEDIIAPYVEPTHNPILWASRPPIKESLRPTVKKIPFNGRFVEAQLEVMEHPYDRLLDHKERGRKLNGPHKPRTNEYSLQATQRTVGLIFRSNLKSSGRGVNGHTMSELWYLPLPRAVRKSGTTIYTRATRNHGRSDYAYTTDHDMVYAHSYIGEALTRRVTMHEYDEAPLTAADLQARRIGYSILRDAMMHPIITPVRN